METNALAIKMKLKPGSRAAIIAAPDGYLKELLPLPSKVKISESLEEKFDWVQIFVRNKSELEKLVPRAFRALHGDGMLWISFPKGSSKIQTDLTRDKGWDAMKKIELKWIKLISVNDSWSAFSFRPYKPSEKNQKSW